MRPTYGYKIRHLAIRFQNLLRGHNETMLDRWLDDAKGCGIPAVVNFTRTLMIDIQAVRDAVIEHWSNGQTEGQINRLKTLIARPLPRHSPDDCRGLSSLAVHEALFRGVNREFLSTHNGAHLNILSARVTGRAAESSPCPRTEPAVPPPPTSDTGGPAGR